MPRITHARIHLPDLDHADDDRAVVEAKWSNGQTTHCLTYQLGEFTFSPHEFLGLTPADVLTLSRQHDLAFYRERG